MSTHKGPPCTYLLLAVLPLLLEAPQLLRQRGHHRSTPAATADTAAGHAPEDFAGLLPASILDMDTQLSEPSWISIQT